MANQVLMRPRCVVCGKVMFVTFNRFAPLELALLLGSVQIPFEIVRQYECLDQHGSVWHVPIPGGKDLWVH